MSAVLPPVTWTRLRMSFQAVLAAVRRASKSKLGLSAARFALALATLTYDSATATWTTRLVLVSNVANAPVWVPLAEFEPLEIVPPVHVPCAVGARSNDIAKNTWKVLEPPQNPPVVIWPVIVEPENVTDPARLPVALRLVLTSSCAVA